MAYQCWDQVWTLIRPLGDWHKVALQTAARQDWSGQAHEIFSQRLGKITE